jgi:hypothetical protein
VQVLAHLLKTLAAERPERMSKDELVPTLTWADLEREWEAIASPANRHLVQDAVTALWKQSGWLPEAHTLSCILTATVLLAGPDCILGSREGPATPS